MSLAKDQRKLDRRIEYLRERTELKVKIKISIRDISHNKKTTEKRKSHLLKSKMRFLRTLEADEFWILKDIEYQAKAIMKKYFKEDGTVKEIKPNNDIDLDTYNELRNVS
jgi:hypothetical protein